MRRVKWKPKEGIKIAINIVQVYNNMMKELTDRNEQIVEDKKTMSYRQLSEKYDLSHQRIQAIIKRAKENNK